MKQTTTKCLYVKLLYVLCRSSSMLLYMFMVYNISCR